MFKGAINWAKVFMCCLFHFHEGHRPKLQGTTMLRFPPKRLTRRCPWSGETWCAPTWRIRIYPGVCRGRDANRKSYSERNAEEYIEALVQSHLEVTEH